MLKQRQRERLEHVHVRVLISKDGYFELEPEMSGETVELLEESEEMKWCCFVHED